jgi:superfamily II DNA or RNA helicase
MPQPVELSRQFLSDAGGWKEMKEARAIHAAGRVSGASYRDGILEAEVREGAKTLKVRGEIRSRTDVVNHCPCFRARRDGILCAHLLAAGLEVLEPTAPKAEARTPGASPERGSAAPAKTPLHPAWPTGTEEAEDGAVPATLHLVVAPNFATAWEKGRVTVGVEVARDGGRTLLKALPTGTRLFLDAGDAALLRSLQELSHSEVPGMLLLAPDDLSRLFASVPGHPGITLGKSGPLRIGHRPLRPVLKRQGGLRFRVEWAKGLVPLVTAAGSWVFDGKETLQPVAHGLEGAAELLAKGTSVSADAFPETLASWRGHFDLAGLEVARSTPVVRLLVEGSLNHLDADLVFIYGAKEYPAAAGRPAVWEDGDRLVLADGESERAAIAELEAAGFERRGEAGRFVLKDKEAILQFLAHGYPAFQQRWETRPGERFEHALGQVEPIVPSMRFRPGGEDWFALEVGFGTPSGDQFSRQEIQRLLESGRHGRPGSKGRIAVLDPRFAGHLGEILSDCDPRQEQPGTYRIDQVQAGYLRETIADHGLRAEGELPWQSRGETIAFGEPDPALAAILRPYQREGLDWMLGLASRGLGGILADDMGLGKTLQTLAFLSTARGRALVVCPSSLVHNWVAEAAKFTPDLKTVAVEGPDRAKILTEHPNAALYVTSYALLRRDEALWEGREFDVVILDEAQHIKNPEAQVSKAAHRLRGRHRFALTGTPVENSPEDLWSILRFALPGYLGSRERFAERFVKPLTSSDPPATVRERLARRLRPVVLRRLKSEVARDLPEKIEQVVRCDLTAKQREVYTKLLQESRRSLLEAEGGKKRMLALTALLRLRQTCCDLRLLGMQDLPEEEVSAKVEAFGELLDEAVGGGHRVLVFSQFTGMLQILAGELAGKGLSYCYLDGSTKDRAAVVNRFQNGDAPVFLISLKAGGVGLNLTAADTVIHADPWWNPAVEAQATDRAHRIGQERIVTSYKLIARDTVEEKILTLQERKRTLTESLLSEAGDAHLSENELMSLFE